MVAFHRVLVIVLIAAPASLAAGDTAKKSAPSAYSVVQRAPMFTIGGVGFSGTITDEEKAFRSLVKASDGAVQCRRLASGSTKAGQLYGLLGLKLLDDPAYQKEAARLLKDRTAVTTMTGCVISQTKVSDLARLIVDGKLK